MPDRSVVYVSRSAHAGLDHMHACLGADGSQPVVVEPVGHSDLLETAVERPHDLETTALGAAFFAGLAVGLWADLDEFADLWSRARCFDPTMAADHRETLVAGWRDALHRTLGTPLIASGRPEA